jgi:hypothetical protein
MPSYGEILEAFVQCNVSYLHVVSLGRRMVIGRWPRQAETFFDLMKVLREDWHVIVLMIQFDIGITTKPIVPHTNNVDPSVPQWMAGDGGPGVGNGPLGDGLQKEHLPLFKILPQYHQVGCVNIKWRANAAGGHHGQLSRGVYSTKCYVTVAHNVRHHMLYIPSGSAKDVLEGIKIITQGKRLVNRLRDLGLTMLHPTIAKTYKHRCEVVFRPRAPKR